MRSFARALIAAIVITACAAPRGTTRDEAPPTVRGSPAPTETATPIRAPSPSPIPARPHVFVIVMENRSLATALRNPSIAALASSYALATNYHAVASPSLPNYLALTSGSTWGIRDSAYHVLPAGGIGAQLTAAGLTWRAYMEGLTEAGCMRSPYPYALKHNPFAYYGGACPENVVALDGLESDLAGDTPSLLWITPGLCHDGHDCTLDVAGPWLEAQVKYIVDSKPYRERGVLFIVWDEGDGGSDQVPLIVAAPDLIARRSDERYDHYSLLATIEDLLGVERLGSAATAKPLSELVALKSR